MHEAHIAAVKQRQVMREQNAFSDPEVIYTLRYIAVKDPHKGRGRSARDDIQAAPDRSFDRLCLPDEFIKLVAGRKYRSVAADVHADSGKLKARELILHHQRRTHKLITDKALAKVPHLGHEDNFMPLCTIRAAPHFVVQRTQDLFFTLQ